MALWAGVIAPGRDAEGGKEKRQSTARNLSGRRESRKLEGCRLPFAVAWLVWAYWVSDMSSMKTSLPPVPTPMPNFTDLPLGGVQVTEHLVQPELLTQSVWPHRV